MENKEKRIQEEETVKPEVRVNGRLYKLRFDLGVLEQIEEEFGGIRQADAALNGGAGMVKAIKKLFAAMANAQRDMDGLPMDVTGDEISRHESIAKLKEIGNAIKAAIKVGQKRETDDGGEASDKKANPLDKEYEAKNG